MQLMMMMVMMIMIIIIMIIVSWERCIKRFGGQIRGKEFTWKRWAYVGG
jgi:hypothetical protein